MSDSTQGGFVNGEFYSFAKAGFSFAGSKLIAFESLDYDDSLDRERIYGANSAPLGSGEGNYEANFKLSVTREDYDDVIAPYIKANGDGTFYGHDPFDFAASYAKSKGKKITKDDIKGVRLNKRAFKAAQGDKKAMVELEGFADGGIWVNGMKPVGTGA
jgi:hypothetical protein